MSCNGCRVLRKRCSKTCVLRTCLEWIESPEAKGHATLFVSKFFGRSDLISFISSVPSQKRNALFQSLLFEAVGRTVNPVNGAIGLLSTGNWHLCQAGVRTVLAGGTPVAIMNMSRTPGSSGVFQAACTEMTIGKEPKLLNLLV
uniref:LOB domain-containing protein 39-like n=1 Tax=Erigeron canadensis TaxID=72917 RepID=UPI001CB8DD45|nr:LOB domain-containing protein 39-like [Erigeron canadensis]